jgi:hypothetical protein
MAEEHLANGALHEPDALESREIEHRTDTMCSKASGLSIGSAHSLCDAGSERRDRASRSLAAFDLSDVVDAVRHMELAERQN